MTITTNIYFNDDTGFRVIEAPVHITAEQALSALKSEKLYPIDDRVMVTFTKKGK